MPLEWFVEAANTTTKRETNIAKRLSEWQMIKKKNTKKKTKKKETKKEAYCPDTDLKVRKKNRGKKKN